MVKVGLDMVKVGLDVEPLLQPNAIIGTTKNKTNTNFIRIV